MAGDDSTIKKLDARSLRGLAHPLRVRILGILRLDGPSTAAKLAKRLGEDTGNISWHLRQLAQHGFIAEDPARGTKRERWWHAIHKYTELAATDFLDDEQTRGPLSVLLREHLEQDFRRAAAYLAEDWGREWREAVAMAQWRFRFTPSQLATVFAELTALLDRHETVHLDPSGDSNDAETVLIQVQAFPHRGEDGAAR